MRFFSKAVLLVAIGAISLVAKADTLDYTLSGGGDVFTWSLPSNPTPLSSTPDFAFVLDTRVSEDGQPMVGAIAIFFNELTASGGLTIFEDPFAVILKGPQLYSGPESNPTLLTGTFDLTSTQTGGPIPYVLQVVDATSAVPEPTSLLLFGAGLTGLIVLKRRGVAQ